VFRQRVRLLLCAFLLAGAVLVARLAQIQLGLFVDDRLAFDPDDYTRASGSHLVETVRGGIYTRWGTPLARQVPSFDLGVKYEQLAEPEWKQSISRLCGVPEEDLAVRAAEITEWVERMEAHVRTRQMEREGYADIRVAERYAYHWVLRDAPPEAAAAVRTEPERFPGIVVMEGTRREYPNGELAPHVVGGFGRMTPEKWRDVCETDRAWTMNMPLASIESRYRKDDSFGTNGVEMACEGLLRGARGYVLKRLAFSILHIEKRSTEVPPVRGNDVYLTIREDFQRAANEALRRAASAPELDFDAGALVILDVRDGAVLAAATYPSYDLATYRDEEHVAELLADPRAPFLFRPVQAALPTGSVYKVITAIAALEEGAIVPSTTHTCHGYDTFEGRRFDCASRWGHGTLSLVPAIEHSCNVYFYHAGLKAGGEALTRWGRLFGLGVPNGVDLPYSRTGQVPDVRATLEIVNLSIGQGGLLCTPLQVAGMMAAVANGGRLYRPHFFDHARDAAGEVVERHEPQFVAIPVSPSTLEPVREGMRLAVESGTARAAGLDPFRAAGKTGTAETGRSGVFHAWFAGYAPFEDPVIAFAIVSELTGGHGGTHAAPIVAFALEEIWGEVEALR